jgi:hypothetical protein
MNKNFTNGRFTSNKKNKSRINSPDTLKLPGSIDNSQIMFDTSADLNSPLNKNEARRCFSSETLESSNVIDKFPSSKI